MIKTLNHVGISVSNLERSVAFYRDLMGMALIRERAFEGGAHEQIMCLKGAKGRIAVLQADTLRLELFEFERPTPRRGDLARPVCDNGITHFCIEMTGLDQEYERLKSAGVPFHSPPIEFAGAAKATYGRDPDGNVFELLEICAVSTADR